ncbi:MAG: penicillin-binding transpeptidase domain-containing protein [Anaerolineae bacterium]
MQREIRRVGAFLLISFFVVGMAAAYWAVTGPNTLLLRGDNPRRVLDAQAVDRGTLLDRDGVALATSERTGNAYTRVYPASANASVLGTVESGVGISGPESAYDALLRGLPVNSVDQALRDLLHEARQGNNVQLSLSNEVQQTLTDAMEGIPGAAVVISLPDGEILGMISQPGVTDAEATPEPGRPTPQPINLALTGEYPLGGALLPGKLSAALLQGVDIIQTEFPAGECAVRLPPDLVITLQEAFLFGCSEPFAAATANITPDALVSTLSSFVVRPSETALSGLMTGYAPSTSEMGEFTASPLSMALMAAAIAEDGAAPAPQLGLGWSAPDSDSQTSLRTASPRLPVTTATTARRLQDLMRQAVAEGAAQNAGRPRLDIGGIATLSGTDDVPLSWFVGFTSLPEGKGAAVALVLDGSRDTGLAADAGGAALEAAATVLQGGN